MSYTSIVQMASSATLAARISAAAADEGQADPVGWTSRNIWAIVASDQGWSDAWDYALANATDDDNPDTGARPGVINDSMILTVVQAMLAAEAGP